MSIVVPALSLLLAPVQARAQASEGPEVGETVRINGDFVGRVVSVDAAALTVFGQGRPTCTAGIHHGEAAICSPAPMEQQTVDMNAASVERAVPGGSKTKRLIAGVAIGGVLGAGGGYAIGPVLGFGRLTTCAGEPGFEVCSHSNTPPDVQRSSDQLRGTIFLGVVGATVGGLLANALTPDWVTIQPGSPTGSDSNWTLELTLPLPNRF